MKKIYTKHFPMKGFKALTLWPFIFVREDRKDYFTAKDERHETTHAIQQVECLWLLFLVIYGAEYVIKLPFCKFDTIRAYMSISFEQEAYEHEAETYYNEVRRHYAWLRYLFTLY